MCGCYRRPVSILVRYNNEVLNIYLCVDRRKRWRISRFSSSMLLFAKAQRLDSLFGRLDYGLLPAVPCSAYNRVESRRRRKRTSSIEEGTKKRVCVIEPAN